MAIVLPVVVFLFLGVSIFCVWRVSRQPTQAGYEEVPSTES